MATAFMGYKNNSPKSYNYKLSSLNNLKSLNNNEINNKLMYNNKLFKFNHNQIRYKSYYVNIDQDETKPEEIFNKLGIKVNDY
jgi:hypothetical protein